MGGGEVIAIPLSRGLFALVDEEDYSKVHPYTWCASRKRYTDMVMAPIRGQRNRFVYLHRVIMAPPKGFLVDHRDGDGLNNRRENLRVCTVAENNRNRRRMQRTNTSGVRGAYWSAERARWEATISVNDRTVHLGRFRTKEEAHAAYAVAAIRFYGDFAGVVS